MLGEEGRPLLVNQGGVGLQRVADLLGGPAVGLAHLQHPPVEGDATQGRLPTLPQHRHLAVGAGREQLAHVDPRRLLAHELPRCVVEQLLGQEEAVLAVQVAGSAGGLGDHGQGQAGPEHRPLGHLVLRNACVCHGPPA